MENGKAERGGLDESKKQALHYMKTLTEVARESFLILDANLRVLSANPVFPPIVGQMVRVGEETGKVDEVLGRLSIYFENESEHLIRNLTVALEPVILIVLGVGVGVLVLSIILPIYNLTSQF